MIAASAVAWARSTAISLAPLSEVQAVISAAVRRKVISVAVFMVLAQGLLNLVATRFTGSDFKV